MRATFFRRKAGATVYHADRKDWVESGRSVCGVAIGIGYVYRSGDPATWQGTECEQLSHYPRRYGQTRPCAHCVARLAKEAN